MVLGTISLGLSSLGLLPQVSQTGAAIVVCTSAFVADASVGVQGQAAVIACHGLMVADGRAGASGRGRAGCRSAATAAARMFWEVDPSSPSAWLPQSVVDDPWTPQGDAPAAWTAQ